MEKMKLQIVTPDKTLYQSEVSYVVVPALDGQISVLPGHIPLITAIKPGEIKIVNDSNEEFFSITKGVLETDGKSVTILADSGERAEEIDETRAQEAMNRAKEMMSKEYKDKVSYADAISELERATSRLKIVKKRRGARRSNFGNSNM
ncbi:MAG: ATP synthase F1 subunit epsilon [Candidatus Gracilibacteria bacterium]|jgi:F-type H+-transporting ATPase subunit epsilon|nr:ATP synthase F1 subunit epsilon [Candidatus Gracilibacteria bacterium]